MFVIRIDGKRGLVIKVANGKKLHESSDLFLPAENEYHHKIWINIGLILNNFQISILMIDTCRECHCASFLQIYLIRLLFLVYEIIEKNTIFTNETNYKIQIFNLSSL